MKPGRVYYRGAGGNLCHDRSMKKQASDQQFHDRRYQERKRAEAAKRPAQAKNAPKDGRQAAASPGKEATKE